MCYVHYRNTGAFIAAYFMEFEVFVGMQSLGTVRAPEQSGVTESLVPGVLKDLKMGISGTGIKPAGAVRWEVRWSTDRARGMQTKTGSIPVP